jgi:FixJ family two-component response regulator
MIVEDDPGVMRALVRVLWDLGDLVIAFSGDEAIMTLEGSINLAALVIDPGLGPGPDGFEVDRAAGALGFAGAVLMLTGRSSDEMLAAANKRHIPLLSKLFFLEKPIRGNELKSEILAHAHVDIAANDPRLLDEFDRARITPKDRRILLGAMNGHTKEELLHELDLTKEGCKWHVHQFLARLGLRGRSLEDAGMVLRERVFARLRPRDSRYEQLIARTTEVRDASRALHKSGAHPIPAAPLRKVVALRSR